MQYHIPLIKFGGPLLLLLFVGELSAQDKGDHFSGLSHRSYLTGSWNGNRTMLESSGVAILSTLTTDVMSNIRGGAQRGTALLENWQVGVDMSMEPLIGWVGGFVSVSALQNNGGRLSKYIGDVQTANNIEAVQTIRFFEVWVQQLLFENHISALAGVYDINTEFDVIETGTLFINSSQGIGGAVAASGLVGPPTFPATGLAARVKIMPDPSWYWQNAITDGVPGSNHVDWQLSSGQGSFFISEVGFVLSDGKSDSFRNRSHINKTVSADYILKVALGGWGYSRNYVDQRYGIPQSSDKSEKGSYLLVDVQSLSAVHEKLESLSGYFRIGIADNSLSRLRYYLGSGITYEGLLSADPDGVMGISMAAVSNSAVYKQFETNRASAPEVALEWTYKTSLAPWLNLQPDVQYIINPGAVKDKKPALMVGLRSEISL